MEGDTARIVTWLRPIIPKRLMILLSGTDNRRNIWNHTARHGTWQAATGGIPLRGLLHEYRVNSTRRGGVTTPRT